MDGLVPRLVADSSEPGLLEPFRCASTLARTGETGGFRSATSTTWEGSSLISYTWADLEDHLGGITLADLEARLRSISSGAVVIDIVFTDSAPLVL